VVDSSVSVLARDTASHLKSCTTGQVDSLTTINVVSLLPCVWGRVSAWISCLDEKLECEWADGNGQEVPAPCLVGRTSSSSLSVEPGSAEP
jgi:hypothetical protein